MIWFTYCSLYDPSKNDLFSRNLFQNPEDAGFLKAPYYNMKKLLLICLPLLLLSARLNAQVMNFKTDDYAGDWKEIAKLEEQNLPKSALEKAEKLYAKAKADHNPSQIIKTLIYKNKYTSQLEEDGFVKAVYRMEQETAAAYFPEKPVLQSMLGELYAEYLSSNYWRFRDRTNTGNFKPEDIRTWDVARLNEEAAKFYRASLTDARIKNLPIHNFDAVTTKGSDELRPTLYDFLAHRAIDHFSNERNYLSKPAYQFYIDQESAFADVPDFVNQHFQTRDSSSDKFLALTLFQELLRSHQNDSTPGALIDADLKRLDFIHQHSVAEGKDSLYMIALEKMRFKYQDAPEFVEITYKTALQYQANAEHFAPNPDDLGKWDLKKAKDICEQAISRFPKAYGVASCKALIQSIKDTAVSIKVEEVNLPNRPILGLVNFKNTDSVYFKVVRMQDRSNDDERYDDDQKRLKHYNALTALKTWVVALPNDGDFREHSAEFKIDKLPAGFYLLMASDNPDFHTAKNGKVNYAFFHASNLAYWNRTTDTGTNEVVVMDRLTGNPIKGAIAEFFVDHYDPTSRKNVLKKVGNGVSDEKGFIYPRLTKNTTFYIKLIHGADTLFTGDGFYHYYSDPLKVKYVTTHFFLDRAIYRPGQTVYFKGIVVETDENGAPSIKPKTGVTIELFDVNNQKAQSLTLETNEFGTVNGTFTAPATGLLGRMSIRAANQQNSAQSFRVEEYKRPRFEATFKPVEGAYRLGDTVKVQGFAKSFAGSNIDGAHIKYRVTRQAEFPRWYGSYNWADYFRPQGEAQEIAHGDVVADATGAFEVSFKALADRSIPRTANPEFHYKITADVMDITGETHFAVTTTVVGYASAKLDIATPERVNRKKFKPFQLVTQNLNGQFEALKGRITIDLLSSPKRPYVTRYWQNPDTFILTKTEFNRDFPLYSYRDEDKVEHWLKKRQAYKGTFNTAKNKEWSIDSIAKWEPGSYRVTLKAEDANGEPLETVKYFTLYDLDDKVTPINKVTFTVLEKEVYQPGDKVDFYIGTAEESLKILMELEKDGKIIKSEWVDIEGLQKIEFDILESDRGNIHYHLNYVKNNRSYHDITTLNVPYDNKKLSFEYETFRDKLLPGQEEEWRIKVSGQSKDKIAAEMVAAMYDASLDQFAANSWGLDLYRTNYPRVVFGDNTFKVVDGRLIYVYNNSNNNDGEQEKEYRSLEWFGFEFESGGRIRPMMARSAAPMDAKHAKQSEPATISIPQNDASSEVVVTGYGTLKKDSQLEVNPLQAKKKAEDKESLDLGSNLSTVQLRTNLKETVFFFPDLTTDEQGDVLIKFKMNEALTRWKFLGLAHTKDLKVGTTERTVVTQKDLMVFPNAPRFFREGDEIEFTAKVSNLSAKSLTGSAQLLLFDATTMQPVDALMSNNASELSWTAASGQSAPLSWKLKVPFGKVQVLTYRVVAKSGDFSDGEENSVPVLTNRMLVTETMPLPVRAGQTKNFVFESLKNAGQSNTLQNQSLKLEFTSNPAWYAVQALPYLMEYPYECTEQVFSRYYANSLASYAANSNPKIKTVFDQWKGTDALESNLSKNQELKTALLEETPWVLDAQNEAAQKKRIGLLFDLNKMGAEKTKALSQLAERQLSNGGFSWFPGDRDDWYITQNLVEGFGRLNKLGVNKDALDQKTNAMIQKALAYTDVRVNEYYQEIAKEVEKGHDKWENDHLSPIVIHYLYTRSLFPDAERAAATQKAVDYFMGQRAKYWLNKGIYLEGMIALSLSRTQKSAGTDAATATAIVKSLKERALNNEELGMYWKQEWGYRWYESPIETQALMIEVFNDVAKDVESVDALKTWLLKNKQTNNWKTTKATAAAVFALLENGTDFLAEDNDVAIVVGGKPITIAAADKEPGTGYFKTSFNVADITPAMAEVKVTNPNKTVAWGAMYWQYFEDLDKIKTFKETPLTIVKQFFKEENTESGPVLKALTEGALKSGDKVKVRIEIRADRDMEYIHLKDMRAAGLEPVNVLSQFKWQGGLGYYESTRDASTNFFITSLPKGTYVFEYPLVVNLKGDFSAGISTIQCMYAPEFSSHSQGSRLKVE